MPLCPKGGSSHLIRRFAFFLLSWLALACLFYSPFFLAYSDLPRKSQAVILFRGPDYEERERAALQLMRDGYARFLLIPAFQTVYWLNEQGLLQNLPPNEITPRADSRAGKASGFSPLECIQAEDFIKYFRYVENTHIEVIRLRRMMECLGLKRAILVSSPYHMRRIKMIAAKVFNPPTHSVSPESVGFSSEKNYEGGLSDFQLLYMAASHEQGSPFWFLRKKDLLFVFSEYLKMVWFHLYAPFAL